MLVSLPIVSAKNLKLSSQTNGFQDYGVTWSSGKKEKFVRAESVLGPRALLHYYVLWRFF